MPSSLAFIDGTVVTVALPAIQDDYGAGFDAAQWVLNGYALMLGALVIVTGSLGNRFGRRRVFVAGIVLFTAASIGCAAASSIAVLVGARVVQGIGAACWCRRALPFSRPPSRAASAARRSAPGPRRRARPAPSARRSAASSSTRRTGGPRSGLTCRWPRSRSGSPFARCPRADPDVRGPIDWTGAAEEAALDAFLAAYRSAMWAAARLAAVAALAAAAFVGNGPAAKGGRLSRSERRG